MTRDNANHVWHGLSQQRKWEVLQRLVKRFDRNLPPGAQSVSIGYRTLTSPQARRELAHTARYRQRTAKRPARLIASRAHARVLTSELCLRFYVVRKLKKPRQPLPPFVVVTIGVRSRRRKCQVPTDVAVTPRGRPQSYFRATRNGDSVEAAGCCIVNDAADRSIQYLVGCHHAFTLSLSNGNVEVNAVNVTLEGTPVGDLYTCSRLRVPGGVGFDAALVRVRSNMVWPRYVLDRQPAVCLDRALPPTQVTIETPRGRIKAEFVDYAPRMSLRYGNEYLTVGPIFQFNALTYAGDSGSPVLDGSTLCGMHFYGDPGAELALAHPAEAIFRSGRFKGGVRIRLA